MAKRLLDKTNVPTLEAFFAYCGDSRLYLEELDEYLTTIWHQDKLLRFPYGKDYGWGLKYFYKNKHLCDCFAEEGAFVVMTRLSNPTLSLIYEELSDNGKKVVDAKYPCNNGGWLHYRIMSLAHLEDAKLILTTKLEKDLKEKCKEY